MLSFVVKHFVIFIWEKCYTNKFYLLTQKDHHLCSEDERKPYRFGNTN